MGRLCGMCIYVCMCVHTYIHICSSNSKESAYDAEDQDLIPGYGRSAGEENGNPLQYSCLENPMDIEAWRATVHGVSKSWT